MDFVTHGDLARLSSSRGAATSRLTPPECPATFTKPLSVRGPRVGLLGRVRASRARAQNTAPAFARFARELGVAHCQVVRLRPCAVCVAGVDGGKLRAAQRSIRV